MDSAVPYLSAKDDYSLFNVYKHTALKTYSPFLRNQDFLNPCSHGDMENIKAVITPSKPRVSLANTPVHSSSTSTAFHNQGLEKERGISSGDARLEVFSDRCDINGFPVKTKDKDEAETSLQSDGISHGCSVRHCNNCTDGNIWASSTSRQTSVALSDLDIRKGKKRIFIREEWPSIKDTPKDQKKRRCYSQKRKSAITQKTADPAASAKEPPNDFIQVRASRGQARDSHSLAERARTEKINKRLRILKDLVPGCPKKVGKAVLLEELINYVQTLHKQIKVLSMKVAALSPPHDSSVELTTSAKEQPLVEDGGVLVPSFSFSGTSHDSKIKRASTSPLG